MDDLIYFSIIIPAFNRAGIISRCIDSCLSQTYKNFEVVIVDDGSIDGTFEVLERYKKQNNKIKVIKHDKNKGICPARHSAIKHAKGEWIVGLDSDWTLYPNALQELKTIINTRPSDILVIRSRVDWDNGQISPKFIPKKPISYQERIQWVEIEGGSDALMCVDKKLYDKVIYDANRRITEALFQLDLAYQAGLTLYVAQTLAMEHTDSQNSYSRSADFSSVVDKSSAAGDLLWMYEEILRRHGASLNKWGPKQHQLVLQGAALNAFLVGDKKKGSHYALSNIKGAPTSFSETMNVFMMMMLGLIDKQVLLYARYFRKILMQR